MAEVLSVAASIAGLASLLDLVARRIFKYAGKAKNAEKEVNGLIMEITDFYGVLNKLQLVACRFEDEKFDSTMQVYQITSCGKLLGRIRSRLGDFDPNEYKEKRMGLAKKLKWPFSSSETEELIVELGRYKATWSLALEADGMSTLLSVLTKQTSQSKVLNEIQTELKSQRHISLNKQRRKILDSLGNIEPERYQENNLKLRQQDTGDWFVNGPYLKKWMDTKNAKLWLHGIPGAGKTILASLIIHEAQKSANEEVGLAYFYCDYKDTSTLDLVNILCSIVKQFAIQHEQCFEKLEAFYKACHPKGKQPTSFTTESLRLLLREMTDCLEHALVIVDALDECRQDRSSIVEVLTGLNIAGETTIKTLFTSRREIDLELHLSDYDQVSIAANTADLEIYVASEIEVRIRKRKLRLRDPGLKDVIMERLIGGAQGMFRWVTYQLDYLCQLSTNGACRKALYTLPPTLFETYERILTRVNETCEENQLLVERVLRWTVCAKEPLSVEALLEVLALREEHTRLDRDYTPNEEKILELCSSLIRRTPNSSGFELAHFTVKEFLLAIDPAKKDSFSRYHIGHDKDEVQLASDCLRYLCFGDFEAVGCNDNESMNQQLEQFSFYSYAAFHWDNHAHTHLAHSGLRNQVQTFFAPWKTEQFICWSQYYYYRSCEDEALDDDEQVNTSNTTTLHWASCLALPEICEWLIEEGCEVDKGSGLGSPLRCAILSTCCFANDWSAIDNALDKRRPLARIETIELLLSAGASMYNKPHQGSDDSLLFLAIQQQLGLEEPLLAAGAMIDEDVLRWMAGKNLDTLELVSEKNLCEEIKPKYLELIQNLKKNDVEVVTKLLENRREQEDESTHSIAAKTALQEAAVWGKIKMLKNIVQRPDLDLNSTFGSDGSTALHLSSLNGHYEVVKILVGKGSKLHQRNNDGNTPAHQATLGGNLKVLKYLQDNGANLHEINKYGLTPLHIAAQGSNIEVLQHLLQIGQEDLLSRTEDGRIPLMCAAEKGSLDVARLIVENSSKSDFQVKSQDGHTCLHFAAMSFKHGMLNLFIDRGIPMDVQSDDGSTALNYSIKNKDACDDFDLLLEKGASLTIPMNDGTLPIHQICQDLCDSSIDRLEALLRVTGNDATYLNAKTSSGITPLQLLTSPDIIYVEAVGMVKTLTSQIEVDVECLNERHETPLIQLAKKLGYKYLPKVYEDRVLASMGYLLACRANSNATCQDSRTALHYMFSDHATLVTCKGANLLLDHDAKIDIQDKFGQTVVDLFFDMWKPKQAWFHQTDCATRIARMFISKTPNLFELNRSGLGLIHIASKNGQDRIIEDLLLAKVDVDTPTSERKTALHLATFYGHLSTAELLLQHSANAFAKDEYGVSIAHTSASSGSESVCRLAWERGVPWNEGATTTLGNKRCRSVLPLHLASWGGHTSVTEFLLKKQLVPDVDIAADQNYRFTPLHLACWANAADTAKLLLSKGANVNSVEGHWGGTPLHFAVLHKTTPETESVISILLARGSDLKKLDYCGLTPEATALERGNKKAAQIIREYQEKIADQRITETSVSSRTKSSKLEDDMRIQISRRLISAVCEGDLEACHHLLERGVEIDMPKECGGCTPFIHSYLWGNFDIIKFLLRRGANYNSTTYDSEATRGYTAVHYAACHGNLDILKFLLGKLTSWSRFGVKPFHLAAANGHLECLKFLLNHEKSTSNPRGSVNLGINDGSDPDYGRVYLKDSVQAVSVPCGTTALHLASAGGSVDVVAFLVREGAQTGKADTAGQTALHYAASKGRTDIIDVLLEEGAYLEMADKGGYTPLSIAVMSGQTAVAKQLLAAGANVNCRDFAGGMLLHHAARHDQTSIIDILQEYDIDLTIKDVTGQLAIHRALHSNRVATFKRLLSKETDLEACDINGISLLQHMILNGPDDIEVIAMERFSGCDFPRNSRYGTLLNSACAYRRLYCVKELLKRAPKENVSTYLNNRCYTGTPLYSAAFGNFPEIIEALLEAGASLDMVGGELGSPLHAACTTGRMAATKLLLKRGAKLDCTKEDGTIISAMDAASRFKNVQALVQRFQDEGIEGLENFDEDELGRAHRAGRVQELGEVEEPGNIEERGDTEEHGKAEEPVT